jgi:hypothetical protein
MLMFYWPVIVWQATLKMFAEPAATAEEWPRRVSSGAPTVIMME